MEKQIEPIFLHVKKKNPKPVDYKRIYQKLMTSLLLTSCSCQFDLFMQVGVESAGKRAKQIFCILWVGWY